MRYRDQTLAREAVRVLCKAQRCLSCLSEHFSKISFKKKRKIELELQKLNLSQAFPVKFLVFHSAFVGWEQGSIHALQRSEVMELQGRAAAACRGAGAARAPSSRGWAVGGTAFWEARRRDGCSTGPGWCSWPALGPAVPEGLRTFTWGRTSAAAQQRPQALPTALSSAQRDRTHLLLSPSLQPQLPLPPSWETMLHRLQLYHTALGTAEGERPSPASFLLIWRTPCRSLLRARPLMPMQSEGKRC